jgi:hypothetical protein
MGCDGGSIPTRCELVKTKKKEERADPTEITRVRWTLCALSKEPLVPPVVACPVGQLFNKEAVLTQLLQKNLPSAFSYIKSMKDLLELTLAENPAWGKVDGAVRFACPVTGVEANGRHGGFTALRGCGCVFSERALREVPSTECLQCRRPFVRDTDLLPLNPSPETAEQLLREWKERRRAKASKSNKKNKNKRRDTKRTEKPSASSAASAAKKPRLEDQPSSAQAANGSSSKKPRLENLPSSAQANGSSVVSKMSKEVYQSIFLGGEKKRKASSFTHYG